MTENLQHVVLIPDGNRRWACKKGWKVHQGHKMGAEAVDRFLDVCREKNVRVATIWGFSTENWKRDRLEIDSIMRLISELLNRNKIRFIDEKIRLVHLGRKDRLEKNYPALLKKIGHFEVRTQAHEEFTLNLAIDYGGRDEIVRVVNKLLKSGFSGKLIDQQQFEGFLDTKGQPDPDLIIRTSGEKRLSGILPYQSDYAELCFVDEFLPDLSRDRIIKIFDEFKKRDRRLGGNSADTTGENNA